MALQDLSRIILRKTVIGITCPSCGGDLQVVQRTAPDLWHRVFLCLSRRVFRYQCKSCGHRFRMHRQYK